MLGAEVAVSAFVKILLQKLTSMSEERIGLYRDLEADLHGLRTKLDSIQSDLQLTEMQQRRSNHIQNWLIDLKVAAYDVQDILADAEVQNYRRMLDFEGGKYYLYLSTPLLPRYTLARKVQNIQKRLDVIYTHRPQLHDSNYVGGVVNRYGATPGSRETSSLPLVNESELVGRDEEKEMIIQKLIDNELDGHDLSAYGIWGMGGLGKTTLAQHVFNDGRIQKHFGLLIWVCVSEDFSTRRMVGSIIQSIDVIPCNLSELDVLQRELREKLKGKKFLLVLDDIWNEDVSLWDSLKAILRCDSKGSLVLVTTRNENIASMMATIGVHQIGVLNEEDSWSLFQKRASSTGEVDERFVTIGKKIVGKCGGVPLAIKTLGSLMRSKTEVSEWMTVQKSEFWHLKDVENGVLLVLKFSYYNLEPHMRQCFAYCCIFPKDYEMDMDQIIQLWMANDFIPSVGRRDLFDIGRSIFKELVWKSFFQDIQKNKQGRTTCKMHDLATSVMMHETSSDNSSWKVTIPKPIRHFYADGRVIHKIEPLGNDSLRSVLVTSYHEQLCSLFSNQQNLRAIYVQNTGVMKKLPNFMCKFQHLKYLVMWCYKMRALPKSFTRLFNLQTLILMRSCDLLELPNDLKVMKELRFLEIEKSDSLRCTPPRLGDLIYLRRLSVFIVGEHPSQQIDQLKGLNLEGELTIKGLDNVRNLEDAKNSNLEGKRNLTRLKLYWTENPKSKLPKHYEEVLKGLKPNHDNLKEVLIHAYHGSKFPKWMTSSTFAHLEEICLEKCERCEELPPLGNLPALKMLKLLWINSVRQLGKEWLGDDSFPSLTSVTIREMSSLDS